ncbi:MAG: metal-dependent hydrolase [Patescibacteria group bacterium]
MPLDIAAGIFIAIIITGSASPALGLVILSVIFALLPDADFFLHALRRGNVFGKWAHEHRDLFHKPLLYIPLGVLALLPFGGEFVQVFVVASLFHFLHDTVGMGWGVKLFWPFSKRNYKFFGGEDKLFSSKFMTSWSDKELREMVAARNAENWVKKFYFRPHPLGLFEYAMLLLALATLALSSY